MGLGVGDTGEQAYVGGHDGGSRLRCDSQVVGVGEAADVVAHDRARLVCIPGDAGAPGVDRDRQVEAGVEGLYGRDDAVDLLLRAHLRPRARLDASHVQDEVIGRLFREPSGQSADHWKGILGREAVDGRR